MFKINAKNMLIVGVLFMVTVLSLIAFRGYIAETFSNLGKTFSIGEKEVPPSDRNLTQAEMEKTEQEIELNEKANEKPNLKVVVPKVQGNFLIMKTIKEQNSSSRGLISQEINSFVNTGGKVDVALIEKSIKQQNITDKNLDYLFIVGETKWSIGNAVYLTKKYKPKHIVLDPRLFNNRTMQEYLKFLKSNNLVYSQLSTKGFKVKNTFITFPYITPIQRGVMIKNSRDIILYTNSAMDINTVPKRIKRITTLPINTWVIKSKDKGILQKTIANATNKNKPLTATGEPLIVDKSTLKKDLFVKEFNEITTDYTHLDRGQIAILESNGFRTKIKVK